MTISKALIVDDSKLSRMTLRRLLKVEDIASIEAESVAEALEKLDREQVDIIFMDIMMPQVDGFEGIEKIKQNAKYADIPCVMYSGNLSIESQEEAIQKGAKGYLFKPASQSSLQHILTSISDLSEDKTPPKLDEIGPLIEKQQTDQYDQQMMQLEKSINTIEVRTKNLARVLMQERKEREILGNEFTNQKNFVMEQTDRIRIEYLEQDNNKDRVEKNFKAQMKIMQKTIYRLAVISIFSIIVSVIAIAIHFIS